MTIKVRKLVPSPEREREREGERNSFLYHSRMCVRVPERGREWEACILGGHGGQLTAWCEGEREKNIFIVAVMVPSQRRGCVLLIKGKGGHLLCGGRERERDQRLLPRVGKGREELSTHFLRL